MLEHWPDGGELLRDVVVCEQEGDRITHDIIQRLNSTFVTPIDREDIYALASALDDIVDFIEEVCRLPRRCTGSRRRWTRRTEMAHILHQSAARDRRRDPAPAHVQGHPPLHRRGQPARERRRPRAARGARLAVRAGDRPDAGDPLEGHLRAARGRDRRHRDASRTSSRASSSRTSRAMDSDVVLWIVVGTALAFDFTNGFHDTANAVATSISTRAMAPRVAVAMASSLNFVGAFLSLAVAATIASGIVNAADITPQIVFAGLVGAIAWNLATWYFGLPSSSSHALIGGVVGSTIAAVGVRRRAVQRAAREGRDPGAGRAGARARRRRHLDPDRLPDHRPPAPGHGRARLPARADHLGRPAVALARHQRCAEDDGDHLPGAGRQREPVVRRATSRRG